MKKLLALVALATGLISHVYAQTYIGQIPAGTVLANNTGTAQAVTPVSATSWFDQAYCNTIGFALVRFTGTWTCAKWIAANPVWWGADPTGVSDSTSALNSAFTASPIVAFPAGAFKFNSAVTVSVASGASVSLRGQGADVTTLTWPNASGGITFNYGNIFSGVHILDLTFATNQVGGGTAINLSQTASNVNPAVSSTSDIRRVTCRGADGYGATDFWTTCVNVANVSNIQFDNLFVNGPSAVGGTGISLIGLPGSSTYGVVYNIAKSTFNNLTTGISYGSFIQGVTVDQSNFTSNLGSGSSTGISVPAAQTGILDQLSVTNSQFAQKISAISLATSVNEVQVANNLFIVQASSGTGLNLTNTFGCNITGNYIAVTTVTGTTGINATGTVQRCTINDNTITGAGTGIAIGASVTGTEVSGNNFAANTTNITNGSTSNTNTGNNLPQIGYNSSPSCSAGAGTWTNNNSTFNIQGKMVFVNVDVTLTAIGTCTGAGFAIGIPLNASTAGTVSGQEKTNTGTAMCTVSAFNLTALLCTGSAALATANRYVLSGWYPLQ